MLQGIDAKLENRLTGTVDEEENTWTYSRSTWPKTHFSEAIVQAGYEHGNELIRMRWD